MLFILYKKFNHSKKTNVTITFIKYLLTLTVCKLQKNVNRRASF